MDADGEHLAGGFGDGEALISAVANEPENVVVGIGDNHLPALLKKSELAVSEEVADEAGTAHAEGLETVALSDSAHGEWIVDFCSVEGDLVRVAADADVVGAGDAQHEVVVITVDAGLRDAQDRQRWLTLLNDETSAVHNGLVGGRLEESS